MEPLYINSRDLLAEVIAFIPFSKIKHFVMDG